jgi:hypothetical protein
LLLEIALYVGNVIAGQISWFTDVYVTFTLVRSFFGIITQQAFLGEKMKQLFQRHFAYHHPLFKAERTAKGNRWDNTVYYFWWEFLRRHDGYKATCENDGKGKYAVLYADFGNVHGLSFKDWWTKDDRGARLFAEPRLPRGVMAMTTEDIETLPADWEPQSLLIVAIPLNLRKRHIQERLTSILTQRHKGERGKTTPKSGSLSNCHQI